MCGDACMGLAMTKTTGGEDWHQAFSSATIYEEFHVCSSAQADVSVSLFCVRSHLAAVRCGATTGRGEDKDIPTCTYARPCEFRKDIRFQFHMCRCASGLHTPPTSLYMHRCIFLSRSPKHAADSDALPCGYGW